MAGTAVGEDEGFFALAKALGTFKAVQLRGEPSDRALAATAGVSTTTVGEWLRGTRFPQEIDKVLILVGAVRAAAAARGIAPDNGPAGLLEEQRWRAVHWAERQRRAGAVSAAVQRAQAAHRPSGALAERPLDQVRDPFALEVHRAVEPDALQPDLPVLPPYVQREHDEKLEHVVRAAAAGHSGLAVLVGGSSTGKTRACWEALRWLRDQPPGWRLWHPIDPSRPDAALRELPAIGPRTVVWLNEAQFYLDASHGLGEQVAAGLRELLRDPGRGPVLVLATLWPSFWDALTSRPEEGQDPHAQARELLAGRDILVPAAFTGPQLQQLREARDVRLSYAATAAQDGQVIQFLAGVPELLARYRNAPPAAAALIHAAMDARRSGMRRALPRAFLEAAAAGYLTDFEWDTLADDWLERALAYTGASCKGVRGPLSRIRPRAADAADSFSGRSSGPVYLLADYLDQQGRSARRDQIPPAAFWAAAASYAVPGDLCSLGDVADGQGLYREAALLIKQAAGHGDTLAAASLVRRLHRIHRTDQRAASWAAATAAIDSPGAVASLLRVLREAGARKQVAVLAGRAATGAPLSDPAGVGPLLRELRDWGLRDQVAVLLARDPAAQAAVGDAGAVASLLHDMWWAGAGEQVAVLAGRAAAGADLGDPTGVARLLSSLVAAGARDQIAVLLARAPAAQAAAGDAGAVGDLLTALRKAGAGEQATVLAGRAAASVPLEKPWAVAHLLHALREAGAQEQIAVLLAREPAVRTDVEAVFPKIGGLPYLIGEMWESGAPGQATTLAARAAQAAAVVRYAFVTAGLLRRLRVVGLQDQVTALATAGAAGAALDDPAAAAELLPALQEAGAQEQIAVLLARNPAAQANLHNPASVAHLLRALRKAGAGDQVTALLARDPAAHVCLASPGAVEFLLQVLRDAGAQDQVTALADRVADEVAWNWPDPAKLSMELLTESWMPLWGRRWSGFLHSREGLQQRFRYGRLPDGSPADEWGWEDLD